MYAHCICWTSSSPRSVQQIMPHHTYLRLQRQLNDRTPDRRLLTSKSKSKSCHNWRYTMELMIRYYFLSESCCVVSVGRPLWREVGSVSCQSLSAVFSPLSKLNFIYILNVTHVLCVYNIYKASVSPGSVQQIMTHHLKLTLQQQSRHLERSYAWPQPSLSLLYFPCWASSCPISRAFEFSWFCITSACYLHNFVI
jgi:hypothetical protein